MQKGRTKMKKKREQKNNSYTFEEYIKKYFPKKISSNILSIENPNALGTSLARASIKKLNKSLSHLQ